MCVSNETTQGTAEMTATFTITDSPVKHETPEAARTAAYEIAVIWWTDRWNNTHPVDPHDHAGRDARAKAAAAHVVRQIDAQIANGSLI